MMTIASEPSAVRLCICCQRTQLDASQLQTCHQCVGQTRRDLLQIGTLYALLPTVIDGYPQQHSSGVTDAVHRAAETPLMGGDSLALLAYGSDGRSQLDGHYADDGRYVLPSHAVDEQPDDTASVLWELEREERDWRHERGVAAATTPPTISNITGYLHANLTWAAQHHPGFDDSATTIGRLRGRLEQACGSGERAIRSPVPCFGCGERRLAKHYGDSGLTDDWKCSRCHRVYDDAEYHLALRAHLDKRVQVETEAG